MIKTILCITFILIALWLTGCWGYKAKQNKDKANAEQEYDWGVAVNTPIGYPIRFYAAMVGGTPIVRELYTEKEDPIGEMLLVMKATQWDTCLQV